MSAAAAYARASQHDRQDEHDHGHRRRRTRRGDGRFIGTVRALPWLLVLGSTVDEVLERARSAIEFHAGRPFAMHEPVGVAEPADAALCLMVET